MRALVVSLLAIVGGAACSRDSCREYSDYTCAQLERQTYNVYFSDLVPQSGQSSDSYLGRAVGLQACGAVAYDFAALRGARPDEWSYVCCLQTDDSPCAEKHR